MSYRDAHQGRGPDYDAFFSRPHQALLWAREQRILDRILRRHAPRRPLRYLDFACGTGRILTLLAPRMATTVGVDIAPSMLAEVRAPGVDLIAADPTREQVLGDQRFDVITAFRFFANAEPALRDEAMALLARHLAPDGLLIFNNHRHAGIVTRRLRRSGEGMPAEQVDALVRRHGLRRIVRAWTGVLPLSDRRMLPGRVAAPAEAALERVPGMWRLAGDVIYGVTR